MGERSDGRIVGQSEGQTLGRSDGRTVGRTDGQTDRQTDGRTVGHGQKTTCVSFVGSCIKTTNMLKKNCFIICFRRCHFEKNYLHCCLQHTCLPCILLDTRPIAVIHNGAPRCMQLMSGHRQSCKLANH